MNESFTEHPLYRELMKIGSKKKSIRPPKLIDCEVLLGSPEVRRRAGPGASRAERAEHASQALRDLISDIVVPTDRLVAEAALGVADFEGFRIGERQDNLAGREKGRVTLDVFKVRRRVVFQDMVETLERDDQDSRVPLTNKEPVRSSIDLLTSNLRRVARDAFDLECAGLASLLARKIAYSPSMDLEIHLPRGDQHACVAYMFSAYVSFEASSYFGFVENRSLLEEWASDRMEADTVEGLVRVVTAINGYCPLATTNASGESVLQLLNETERESAYRQELYNDIWVPWHRRNVSLGLSTPPCEIELVTAHSCALVHGLSKHLGSDLPSQTQSLFDACEVLGRYCGVTPSVTGIHSPTFDESAEIALRQIKRRLANEGLV